MKQLFLFTIVCLVAAVSCQKEEETSYYQPIDLTGKFYYSYVKGVVTDSVLGNKSLLIGSTTIRINVLNANYLHWKLFV